MDPPDGSGPLYEFHSPTNGLFVRAKLTPGLQAQNDCNVATMPAEVPCVTNATTGETCTVEV